MSFAQDTGYLPNTISQLMSLVRENVNVQFGTTYEEETFLGTNFYKYFYALIQLLQENEIKTSEIVTKLQQYFVLTNETITRPNTTNPGIVDFFAAAGFLASVKKPLDADAGKVFIAVNVDGAAPGYAAVKLQIATLVSKCVVAGVISQGPEVETITLSNSQSFDFKFYLPTKIPVKLRLTLTTSANNQSIILSPDEVRTMLLEHLAARYRLGLAFEPQRYFAVSDAPWTSLVLLEYSTDAGASWSSTVYNSAFNELFTFVAGDITIVEV